MPEVTVATPVYGPAQQMLREAEHMRCFHKAVYEEIDREEETVVPWAESLCHTLLREAIKSIDRTQYMLQMKTVELRTESLAFLVFDVFFENFTVEHIHGIRDDFRQPMFEFASGPNHHYGIHRNSWIDSPAESWVRRLRRYDAAPYPLFRDCTIRNVYKNGRHLTTAEVAREPPLRPEQMIPGTEPEGGPSGEAWVEGPQHSDSDSDLSDGEPGQGPTHEPEFEFDWSSDWESESEPE